MKKIFIILVTPFFVKSVILASGSFGEALKNGKYSTNARIFYFDRGFDGTKPNAKALAAGAIIKYESGDYYGFRFGIAHYGSYRIGGFFSRNEGNGTSILAKDGEDISLLGEAYLKYTLKNTSVILGRQQLSTPLIQQHDLRILPSVYEAVVLKNRDLPDTAVELGYVQAYSGFGSKENKFLDFNANWGKDGLAYIYIKNKSIDNLTLRAQFVKAISDQNQTGGDIKIKDYKYADLKYNLENIGVNSYIKMQIGSNSYVNEKSSLMYGARVGTTVGMFDLSILSNQISNNNFKAVRSGPIYSDYQQGYKEYEPSLSFGAQVMIKPIRDLSFRVAYVNISPDKGYVIDDYTETNLDFKYNINNYSKFRIRYSLKDQTKNSGVADRDDFRIIYYINF